MVKFIVCIWSSNENTSWFSFLDRESADEFYKDASEIVGDIVVLTEVLSLQDNTNK
jgi:hypothetical protein